MSFYRFNGNDVEILEIRVLIGISSMSSCDLRRNKILSTAGEFKRSKLQFKRFMLFINFFI